MGLSNKELLIRILKERTLEQVCEYLDSCWDLYELGYIDSQKEQDLLIHLAENTSALTLWAIHKYVTKNDINFKYTFDCFVEEIENKKAV